MVAGSQHAVSTRCSSRKQICPTSCRVYVGICRVELSRESRDQNGGRMCRECVVVGMAFLRQRTGRMLCGGIYTVCPTECGCEMGKTRTHTQIGYGWARRRKPTCSRATTVQPAISSNQCEANAPSAEAPRVLHWRGVGSMSRQMTWAYTYSTFGLPPRRIYRCGVLARSALGGALGA